MWLLWIMTNVHFKGSNNTIVKPRILPACAQFWLIGEQIVSSVYLLPSHSLFLFYTTHLYSVLKWVGVLPMGTTCMCFVSNKNEATEALHLHQIMNQRKWAVLILTEDWFSQQQTESSSKLILIWEQLPLK